MVTEGSGRRGWVLLCLLGVLYLVATTTPGGSALRWMLNDVERGAEAATFAGPGLLRSTDSPVWIDRAIAAGRIGVELDVVPGESEQSGPARIFTVSADPWQRNFTIGQEAGDLIVRVRRQPGAPNGTPPFVVPDVFARGRPLRLDVALDEAGVRIAVDGRSRLCIGWRGAQPFPLWDPAYPIALGNELTWDRPWLGTVSSARLTVARESVDLLAPGVLDAPFAGPSVLPFAWFSTSPSDLVLNFLLMVPMGFLTARALRNPSVLGALAIWAPLVVLAESVQVFTPGRFPSVSDLLLNLAGIVAGSVVALRWRESEP